MKSQIDLMILIFRQYKNCWERKGAEINKKFKKKNTPTNVLAFVGDPKKEKSFGD